MKLQINDKIFNGRYNDKQELVISLDNDLDIQFKDIRIFKLNETGILRNCFPILNLNEDEVKIVYDFYSDRTLIETQM